MALSWDDFISGGDSGSSSGSDTDTSTTSGDTGPTDTDPETTGVLDDDDSGGTTSSTTSPGSDPSTADDPFAGPGGGGETTTFDPDTGGSGGGTTSGGGGGGTTTTTDDGGSGGTTTGGTGPTDTDPEVTGVLEDDAGTTSGGTTRTDPGGTDDRTGFRDPRDRSTAVTEEVARAEQEQEFAARTFVPEFEDDVPRRVRRARRQAVIDSVIQREEVAGFDATENIRRALPGGFAATFTTDEGEEVTKRFAFTEEAGVGLNLQQRAEAVRRTRRRIEEDTGLKPGEGFNLQFEEDRLVANITEAGRQQLEAEAEPRETAGDRTGSSATQRGTRALTTKPESDVRTTFAREPGPTADAEVGMTRVDGEFVPVGTTRRTSRGFGVSVGAGGRELERFSPGDPVRRSFEAGPTDVGDRRPGGETLPFPDRRQFGKVREATPARPEGAISPASPVSRDVSMTTQVRGPFAEADQPLRTRAPPEFNTDTLTIRGARVEREPGPAADAEIGFDGRRDVEATVRGIQADRLGMAVGAGARERESVPPGTVERRLEESVERQAETAAAERAGVVNPRLRAGIDRDIDLRPGRDFRIEETRERTPEGTLTTRRAELTREGQERVLRTQVRARFPRVQPADIEFEEGEGGRLTARIDRERDAAQEEQPERFGDLPIIIGGEVVGGPAPGQRRIKEGTGTRLEEGSLRDVADAQREAAGALADEIRTADEFPGMQALRLGAPVMGATPEPDTVSEESPLEQGGRKVLAGGVDAVFGELFNPAGVALGLKEAGEFVGYGAQQAAEGRFGRIDPSAPINVENIDIRDPLTGSQVAQARDALSLGFPVAGAVPSVAEMDDTRLRQPTARTTGPVVGDVGELRVAEGGFLGDTQEAVGAAAAGFGRQAREKPLETAGAGIGTLAASYLTIAGAGRLGGRGASRAAAYAIQPDEELVGLAGFRATRKLAGPQTAQRLFPQQEPIFMSEEFGIRTARRAGGALRRGAGRARRAAAARRPSIELETRRTGPGSVPGEFPDANPLGRPLQSEFSARAEASRALESARKEVRSAPLNIRIAAERIRRRIRGGDTETRSFRQLGVEGDLDADDVNYIDLRGEADIDTESGTGTGPTELQDRSQVGGLARGRSTTQRTGTGTDPIAIEVEREQEQVGSGEIEVEPVDRIETEFRGATEAERERERARTEPALSEQELDRLPTGEEFKVGPAGAEVTGPLEHTSPQEIQRPSEVQDFDYEQEFENEIENILEGRFETDYEQEQELEFEMEQEQEQELEIELEAEQETELEGEAFIPRSRRRREEERRRGSEILRRFEAPVATPEEVASGELDPNLGGPLDEDLVDLDA